jgi:hypothetical protein
MEKQPGEFDQLNKIANELQKSMQFKDGILNQPPIQSKVSVNNVPSELPRVP